MGSVAMHESLDSDEAATAEATLTFLDALAAIDGVVEVRRSGGPHFVDQCFEVIVTSRRSAGWRAVRDLEQRILDGYPSARLDVRLTEQTFR